ncbi:ABC transporter permease [Kitasatospora sp. LaBMicrA B282]|uniref:ABC transporter permease n=1 Tax=Kitasatospora sp. LaBMicrA B282 TaxID=3420949 RepID=UPI003D0BD814
MLAAEWLKVWSLRSTPWALAVSALGIVGASLNAAVADYDRWPTLSPQEQAYVRHSGAIFDAYPDTAAMIAMLATGCLGAVAIVSEYAGGLVRTTFAAVPARRAVLGAKVGVLSAVMLVFGLVTATVSFGAAQAVLAGRHATVAAGGTAVVQAVAASALLPVVCALVGLGVGALVRHSATGMVATVFLLMLLPEFFTAKYRWSADLEYAMPHYAWAHLAAEQFVHTPPYP